MFYILYPMCGMAFLTLLILPYVFFNRVKAIRSREADLSVFQLTELEKMPIKLRQHSRHISNLFEVPILFYVVCLAIIVMGVDDNLFAVQGWLYVGLRVSHSFIHLGYNKVTHRVVPFVLSNIVLVTIWLRFVFSIPT